MKTEELTKFQLEGYNPSQTNDVQLNDGFRLVMAKQTIMLEGGKTEFESLDELKKFQVKIVAEILKRAKTTFHFENMKSTSQELLRDCLGELIKGGLYLTEPHGELIYEGKKSAIVKSREFKRLQEFSILVSGAKAYGLLRFKKPEIISINEFKEKEKEHLIKEEERIKWWSSKAQLFFYAIRDYIPFEKPKSVKQTTGAQIFIEKVEYIQGGNMDEELKTIEVSKPEITGDYVRIPVAECAITATIDISPKDGIKALYCGKEKQIATYLFDAEKWTMDEAKEWIGEHAKSLSKAVEKAEVAELGKQLTPEDAGALVPPEQAVGICVCPECDTEVPKTDKPCKEMECPKCGEAMKEKALEKSWDIPIWKSEEQRFVYGIVLQPDIEDGQGDVVSKEEIAKTAHSFMENCQKIGLEHNIIVPQIKIWESYIAPQTMIIAGQEVNKGSWILGVHITEDSIWNQVKSGELTGFSIKGYANTKQE